MTKEELILYQNREKQRKDAEDEAIEAGKPRIKKVEESTGGNTNFMSPTVNGDTSLTATESNISSGAHETTSSSIQSFDAKGSVLSSSMDIGSQTGQGSSSSGQISTVKSSGGVARVGGSSESKIPTINNFAIVKMTGSDNFGKSAYTIGKLSSNRAISAVDYITRDGAIKDEELASNRADKHLDYMTRDDAKSDLTSGVLYDAQGNKITVAETKEMMQDITGERRIVFAPDSRLKLNDGEFQQIISKTVNTFSDDFKKDFDHVFAIHRNTENPHAHLMLTTKSVSGEGVKMYKDELFEMKMRFYENTQELAEQKRDRYEIVYKDNSHQSLAMQIGKFTGDIPAGEFANQNIFLAQRIAEKYDLEFNQKEMEKNTDNIKKFFTDNKDQYNDFITNAKNRYADTFTKYSKDANDLASKYNLQEVPKDIEGFQKYLKVHEKLFLADKIADGRGIQITNADVRNLTSEIRKDESGNITKDGYKDLKASTEWFDRNKQSVNEWNNENKNRISKELSNRFEQLNERVDINFDIPKNRMEGISLNNQYKQNKTIFANDTRKALIDILDSRKFYFKGEYMKNNITKDEYKTNLERIDSLKEKTRAYNDITESALKKYGIDTTLFVREEKNTQFDGIKGESGENKENLEKLLTKALNKKNLTDEQKEKIERVSSTFAKEQKISLSALENAGFKREKLQADFKIEKIEGIVKNINFKETQKELDFQKEALYKSEKPTLDEWKKENMQNYEFVSQKRFEKIRESFQNTIKENENLKGKGEFVDKKIETINTKLEKLSKNIITGKQITKEDFENAGLSTKGLKSKTLESEVEFISKNASNESLINLFLKDEKYTGILEKYSKDTLPAQYLKAVLTKEGLSNEKLELFDTDKRIISKELILNPHNVKISGETISKALFNSDGKLFNKIKSELESEHDLKINNAKDFAKHFDKVGVLNENRQVVANNLQNSVLENDTMKIENNEFLNSKIDSINSKLLKISSDVADGKSILKNSAIDAGLDVSGLQTKTTTKDVEFISKTTSNENLLAPYLENEKFQAAKQMYLKNELRFGYLEKTLQADGVDQKTIDSFAKETRQVNYEFITQPFKLEAGEETISKALFNSDGKLFNKIKSELESEHDLKINNAKDFAQNYHFIGKPSELRVMFQADVFAKLDEFRKTNDLLDDGKYQEFKESLDTKKSLLTDIGRTIRTINDGEIVQNEKSEKFNLSGNKEVDISHLNQLREANSFTSLEKEANGLHTLISKNETLKPLFKTDLMKINADVVEWKDFNKKNIDIEVIPNNEQNKPLLLDAFSQLISNATTNAQKVEVNETDKSTIDKIFNENQKKTDLEMAKSEYLKNGALNKQEASEYISKLSNVRTISNMSYLISVGKIESVPKQYLDGRGIDTNLMSKEMESKDLDIVKMGSSENLRVYQEHKNIQIERAPQEQNGKAVLLDNKELLSDISAAISRSFTKSDMSKNDEERQEDWVTLKAAPKESIGVLQSFIKQAGEELKDANKSEIKNINKDIDGYKATIESLEKIKETAKTIQKETVNKVDELQKPIEETTSQTSQKFETNKISQQELNELKTMTKEHLLYADPANVLNALGIDYKVEKGGSRYNFSIRAEDKHKSAFMYLGKGGTWQFKDFGSNQSGTIENVVMLATGGGMSYKDALNYCLEANGLKNLVTEALDINKSQHQIQLTQEHRDKLEALKNANLEKSAKSDVHSRVVSFREITPKDTTVINFLEARGIDGIPKDMYIIEGEASGVGKDGNAYTYKNIGVGVLTGDMSKPIDLEKVGADIHFLNPKVKSDGSVMKTQSFGVKDITIIPGENADGKSISPFESKMDYAAAAGQLDLSKTISVIANGVGNASKVAEFIKETNPDNVTFFNQNDKAGEKFVENVVEKANIDKFDFIKYEEGELKLDINDLVKNNVLLEDRLITNGNIEVFLEMSTLKSVEQLEVEAMISKGDFKGAEQLLQEAGLDKNVVETLSQKIDILKTLEQVNNTDTTYEVEINSNKTDEQEAKERLAVQEKLMEDEIVKNEKEDLDNQQHQKQEEKAIEKSIEMGM